MNLKELAYNIDFPMDLLEKICATFENANLIVVKEYFKRYVCGDKDFYIKVNEYFDNENSHNLWLYLYLNACLETYEKYFQMGITKEIFFSTMKIFTRTLNESLIKYGEYKFSIEEWTTRQINMKLFRIGMLEYELTEVYQDIIIDGKTFINAYDKVLMVHIPSDVKITKDILGKSYDDCRKFVEKYFPAYANAKFCCNTWLLSPDIEKYLKKDSKLRVFRDDYKIVSINDSISYRNWLFFTDSDDIASYKEDSSLQKAIKKYLLDGGKIRNATGVIINK